MQIGDIVISRAGHDKGKPFIVIGLMSEQFALIADGKTRLVEKPKLKRIKHLRTVEPSGITSSTNAALKKRIKQFISQKEVVCREVTISKRKEP